MERRKGEMAEDLKHFSFAQKDCRGSHWFQEQESKEAHSTPVSPGKQWRKLQDSGSWKQEPEIDPETAGEEFNRKLFLKKTASCWTVFYYFKAFFSKNPGTCEHPDFNTN